MKLYTEHDIENAFNSGRGYGIPDDIKDFNSFIQSITPISLPSDEKISEESMDLFWGDGNSINHVLQYKAFKRGAKWMRDKIQGND